ncbi:MAG: hypothetical protein QI197_08125 [Candidatus Korarchaeota archaeon]|nr:hypothetical protein [Candidatus Korarchaeota archaeon]
MSLGELVFLLLTVVLGIVDFVPTVFYWIQSLFSRGLAKALDAPVARRNWLDWIFTLTWLAVGAISLLMSNPPSVFTLFVFLAFKSGVDLGAKLMYGVHDLKVMKTRRFVTGPLFVALMIAALPSILFLLSWKLFYHLLLNVSAGLLGVPVSKASFYLWLGGVFFGGAFGVLRSRGEEGILLRGELALVLGSSIP